MDDHITGPQRNNEIDEDRGEDRPDLSLDRREQTKRARLRNERIRDYLKDRRSKRTVVTTTRTPRGMEID